MRSEDITATGIVTILSAARYRWNNENDLQAGLAGVLDHFGYPVQREVRLTARDRIDLLVEHVGIEVKVAKAGGAAPIERVLSQLARYAEHDSIDQLVLVSTSVRHRVVPAEIGGKPLQVLIIQGGM